jgi:hypothetical protein
MSHLTPEESMALVVLFLVMTVFKNFYRAVNIFGLSRIEVPNFGVATYNENAYLLTCKRSMAMKVDFCNNSYE